MLRNGVVGSLKNNEAHVMTLYVSKQCIGLIIVMDFRQSHSAVKLITSIRISENRIHKKAFLLSHYYSLADSYPRSRMT